MKELIKELNNRNRLRAEEVEKKSSELIEEIDNSKMIEERENKQAEKKKKATNAMKVFIAIATIIVLIAGAVGLGSLMGWFNNDKEDITVPNFAGMTLEEAESKAQELGLKIEAGEKVYSPDQEEGRITSQSPSKDSLVGEGKVITVNISLGKKDGVVPNLVGKDYKAAKKELEQYGFELGVVVKVTSTKPEDTVITQSIKAGETADKGTVIDVEVSDGKGKEMKEVPMLIGKDVDDAKSEILKAGFKVGNISYEEDPQYEKNVVTSQQYIAGTEVEEGSTIDIVISKGAPEIVTPEKPDNDTGDSPEDNPDAEANTDTEDENAGDESVDGEAVVEDESIEE